ncbi:MAG: DUF4115 domain-containing protein [Candidatus Velthaea sp.]
MSALGESFRTAREARGLTLSDVAEHIHIRSVYLGAIEDEEWSSIGAPVYVRGFIRTYARFLGLDGEDAVARFAERIGSGGPLPAASAAAASKSSSHTPSNRASEPRGPSVWANTGILVAIALVLGVGYEYYQFQAGSSGRATVAAAPSATPGIESSQPARALSGSPAQALPSTEPSSSPSPAGGKNSFAIRLTERSWLRVTIDGTVAMEGVFPSGTVRSFTGKNAFVRAGNAGGVDVTVSGKNVGAMGGAGDVVERTFSLQ